MVIILTCAIRKKKFDSFAAVEQNLENDIKTEYAIMCFPCLKKKPYLQNYELSADLNDQFEYIVEKYTIKKIPLSMATTPEDILEREEELEATQAEVESCGEDFSSFQPVQEVYNMQKIPPCVTIAANAMCSGKKVIKDKPRPSDVLESMSPIPRPTYRNPNYVVIPTKGSLRNRDIMITKREITNQYLNNFSSVFVDNLKDQVPKDPEQFPSLSRPYTSAFRNLPLAENLRSKTICEKKSKKSKTQNVAYSFPNEDFCLVSNDGCIEEELFYEDSDGNSKDQTSYIPESECQYEDDTVGLEGNSKSAIDLKTDMAKEVNVTPFKVVMKSSESDLNSNSTAINNSSQTNMIMDQKEDTINSKNVTYEDIQALDVGYEFTSSEKLGVKPKMTRIHYPHESDRFKDGKLIDPKSPNKKCFSFEPIIVGATPKYFRPDTKIKLYQTSGMRDFSADSPGSTSQLDEKASTKAVTETSFLPKIETESKSQTEDLENNEEYPSYTVSTKTVESNSMNEINCENNNETTTVYQDSVEEISKMYELEAPAHSSPKTKHCEIHITEKKDNMEDGKFLFPSKSRSFQEGTNYGGRRQNYLESKGNDNSSYSSSLVTLKNLDVVDAEPETSGSVHTHDSKTSSVVTSVRSSQPSDGKRATLKWKIVIKHHRDENRSRRNGHRTKSP